MNRKILSEIQDIRSLMGLNESDYIDAKKMYVINKILDSKIELNQFLKDFLYKLSTSSLGSLTDKERKLYDTILKSDGFSDYSNDDSDYQADEFDDETEELESF